MDTSRWTLQRPTASHACFVGVASIHVGELEVFPCCPGPTHHERLWLAPVLPGNTRAPGHPSGKGGSTQQHCAAREGAKRRTCQTLHQDEPALGCEQSDRRRSGECDRLLVSRVADRHLVKTPISPLAQTTRSVRCTNSLSRERTWLPRECLMRDGRTSLGARTIPGRPILARSSEGSRQSLWIPEGCTKT